MVHMWLKVILSRITLARQVMSTVLCVAVVTDFIRILSNVQHKHARPPLAMVAVSFAWLLFEIIASQEFKKQIV